MNFPDRLKPESIAAVILAVTMTAGFSAQPGWAQTNLGTHKSGAAKKNKMPAASQLAASQREPDDRDAALAQLMRRVEELSQRVQELESRQTMPPRQGVEPVAQARAEVPARPPVSTTAQNRDEPPSPAPSRPAPGQFEVNEEDVERALERALVQTGALLLPAGAIEIEPNVIYSYQEDNLVRGSREIIENEQAMNRVLQAGLTLRAGLPFDSQIEFNVPFEYGSQENETGSVSENTRSSSGLGDVSIALTKALLSEKDWWPDLTASVSFDSDTGNDGGDVTLGSGFHELSGSLTAVRRVEPLAFIGGVSYSTSFEKGGVEPGDQVSFTLGTVLATSPDTSLRLLFQQGFAGETKVNGRDIPGSDLETATLTVGGSALLGTRALLDISTGIGLTRDSPDYFIRVSLPIRFDFPAL